MEIKQRGSALGYKILLIIYKVLGYRVVAFLLNFVALYYLFFTPSVKRSMKSYYEKVGLEYSNRVYFRHIKRFALSIFDRFVSRIDADELKMHRDYTKLKLVENGAVALLSHVGGWATAAHAMKQEFVNFNVVMRESTQEKIKNIENEKNRQNERVVKIIDLNQGAIASNIQIANALMAKEVVAMMVDRVVDENKTVTVKFFDTDVKINKNPFDIAFRMKKPMVSIFVMNLGLKEYDVLIDPITTGTIEEMAQEYMETLEKLLRKYPYQWYNFYDYFGA